MYMEFSQEIAVHLIGKYFGEVTARLYGDFYRDKDLDTVKQSVKELLAEFLGEDKAEGIIKQYKFPSRLQ
jgi:hypothetical protein